MNTQPDQQLNAKILLFGEHTLMLNSMALSIPFNRFFGSLVQDPEIDNHPGNRESNAQIRKFYKFLLKKNPTFDSPFILNLKRLAADLEKGLFFESNIPQGYGLGSSGAMVAAIYRKFGFYPDPEYFLSQNLLPDLKSYFASLESYFHGKSSGLDPLISFINQAILISENNKIDTIQTNWSEKIGSGAVFLIDTKVTGETQPLVEYFRNRYDSTDFKKDTDTYYIPLVNSAVRNYISGDTYGLLAVANQLSEFQIRKMTKMIPEEMHEIWREGLNNGSYALKLCGSGGGGMVLGFTSDFEAAKEKLHSFQPIIIHQL